MRGGAIFDETRDYRYLLWRVWNPDEQRLLVVLTNPSTADENSNDPTINHCLKYAMGNSFGSLEVVNAFARKGTNFSDISKLSLHTLVGKENDKFIMAAAQRADEIIVAWGTDGALYNRHFQVLALLPGNLKCFGTTQDGHPYHPQRKRHPLIAVPYQSSLY